MFEQMKEFDTDDPTTWELECPWKEFSKQTPNELYDRLYELLNMDGDDIIDDEVYDKEVITLRKRFIENEELRRFIIELRDEPKTISTQEVIERLISKTEDMKP